MNTYSGFEWLLIDLASRFGLDKKPFNERIEFSVELLDLFKTDSIVELGENLTPWINIADEPEMFTGCALAIWDAYHNRESTWQVGQDAASSGPALLSALLKCEIGMKNTGIIGNTVPDLYQTVADNMGVTAERKKVKNATVPHVYASKATPMEIWGDQYPEFVKAYTDTVPMAELAKNIMVNAWNTKVTFHEWQLPDGAVAHIKVLNTTKKKGYPLGKHTYTYQYSEIGTKQIKEHGTKSLSANTTHSYDGYILRELSRRCNYDYSMVTSAIEALEKPFILPDPCDKLEELQKLYEEFKQISVVAIEYITYRNAGLLSEAYRKELVRILKRMLRHDPFEITNIHDEFKTLPNHVGHMKYWYTELMVETYCSEWWYSVAEKLTGEDFTCLKIDPDPKVIQQIREAEYAIN